MANKNLIINADIPIEQKVLGLIICTGQELTTEMQRNIKHLKLSLTQLQILHTLSFAPKGKLTVNQIKQFMIDDSPNVSRSLNKLMENKLIVKKRRSDDQRIVDILITDAGREMHNKADKELLANSSINLSPEDTEKLYELLIKL